MKNIWYPFLFATISIIITFLLWDGIEIYFTDKLNTLAKHQSQYAIVSFIILASDIILPVPSSIVMYFNGYVLGVVEGTFISLGSLLISSVLGYYLGKLTSLGVKAESEDKSKNILSKYGPIAILMSRGIPILSESISIVCGYNRVSFKQYFIYNFIGYLPLCLLYAYCGSLGHSKDILLLSFIFSLIISVAFWFFGKAFSLKSKMQTPTEA